MQHHTTPSPCLRCTRVTDPRECENKNCKLWQQWFLQRWALIHAYPRAKMDQQALKSEGVSIGGTVYALPHRVRAYRAADPCEKCLCPKDLCKTPCRQKQVWLQAKEDSFL